MPPNAPYLSRGMFYKTSGLYSLFLEEASAAFISCKLLLHYYSSFGLRLITIQETFNLAMAHYPQGMPCRQQHSIWSLVFRLVRSLCCNMDIWLWVLQGKSKSRAIAAFTGSVVQTDLLPLLLQQQAVARAGMSTVRYFIVVSCRRGDADDIPQQGGRWLMSESCLPQWLWDIKPLLGMDFPKKYVLSTFELSGSIRGA